MPAYRVFVVDDDPAFLSSFKEDLQRGLGYVVTTSSNPTEVYSRLDELSGFDAAIVDLWMPQVDGLNLALAIKQKAPDLPVFLNSQDESERSRVLALRVGIEDFLMKTMSKEEIFLRIGNRLKVYSPELGGLRFCLKTGRVHLNEEELDLTPLETQILRLMAFSGKQKRSREEIQSQLWSDRKVSPQTLNSHLHNLNKKLQGWAYIIRIDEAGELTLAKRTNNIRTN